VSYTECKDFQRPLKTQKNGYNTCCILPNELYKFSHQIPSCKISRDVKECIPRGWFELKLTALSTDKFQLTEERDQVQNILEVHSLMSHLSYTKESNEIFCTTIR